ncbi:MAG TPA: secretin and TonB N-terminal domain-containing protein, partial [Gaiellaceae bacterium]|nr:secretin and TonB N-terminal domain-containing protein [Gaiellaceae bacterium]
GAPAAITTPIGIVGGVLTQGYETSVGHMTRLTVSLAQPTSYRVVPQGTSLKVLLAMSGPAIPAGPATKTAPAEPANTPTALVRDIRYERAPATSPGCAPYGCDRVVVDLGSIPAYSLSMSKSGRPRLELRATALPETLARTLDVRAFDGALKTITASHDTDSGAAILELERATEAAGTISVEGGTLIWSFPVPTPSKQPSPIAQLHIDGRAVGKDGGAVRRVVTVAREPEQKDLPRIETSIHDEDPVVETAGGGAAGFASGAGNSVLAQTRYNGRRINIDLKDADIHNVLRLLADTGHVNVVTADDVGGTITIRMVNVPWDQVLDVVLQAKGLGMVRTGNLIRVAKLDQLQKERELKLAAMKQEYELTPLETRLIPISYA